MNQRHHVAIVAAIASIAASQPLSTIFDQWTWLMYSGTATVLVVGAAIGVRTLRAPVWLQVLTMLATLALFVTWMFPSGKEIGGVVPTLDTLRHFSELLGSSGQDIQRFAPPVPDSESLLFLSTIGLGLAAIAIDVCAVALRRPALAGLPMLAIYSVPVAVLTASVNFLPFLAGAAGFCWLLITDNVDRVRRFGRRFTGEGRDVDRWEPSPLAAAGRRLTFVGLVLAVVLPALIPGFTSGLDRFGGTDGAGPGGRGGSGNAVDLFVVLNGELIRGSSTDMVRITSTAPDLPYLRLATLEELDEQHGFKLGRLQGNQQVSSALPDPAKNISSAVARHTYQAQVEILDLNMRLAPAYPQVAGVQGLNANWRYDQTAGTIFSAQQSVNGRRYTETFVDFQPTDAELRSARPLDARDPIQQRYTQVPPIPEVNSLVGDLTKDKTTPYDKAVALRNHFSSKNGFTYSTRTKQGNSGNAIVDFLRNKTGYCEQYAAALAWMARAAGLPARVVVGFARGNRREGNRTTLTNLNLHAWTEIYFSGYGWTMFDATPAGSVVGAVNPAYAPDPTTVGPNTSGTGPANPNSPDGQDLPDKNPQTGLGGDQPQTAAPATPTKPFNWVPVWVGAGMLVLLVLLAAPAVRRRALRRARRPRPVRAGPVPQVVADGTGPPLVFEVTDEAAAEAARRDAHAAWDELTDTMVDFGLSVRPTETPRRTAERLVQSPGLAEDPARAARQLAGVEERARYARHPRTADDLPVLVTAVRDGLSVHLTRTARWRVALFPPSVLRRWRRTAVESFFGVLAAIGRARDAVIRFLVPRRLLTGRSR